MRSRPHILVVAQNPVLANTLFSWLAAAQYELAVVTTFAAAKAHLDTQPDLIISELKLGEFNGLHLALRAHAAGTPCIVIGPRDQVLERDAEQIGATYLSTVLRRRRLLELIDERLRTTEPVVAPLAQDTESVWGFDREAFSAFFHSLARSRVLH